MKNPMYLFKFLLILIFISVLPTLHTANQQLDDYLSAYQDGYYSKAMKIAETQINEPLAQLVYALCQVHDKDSKEFKQGFNNLLKLYKNEKIDKNIRFEAGLSYGRTIQILQIRKRFPEINSINIKTFFKDFLNTAKNTKHSCLAAVYLTDIYFEEYEKNNDRSLADKGFTLLENHISTYRGNKKDLIPIYLFLDNFYIEIQGDYQKSFNVLKKCYDRGITKVTIRREILFKLGRISDIKLNNKATAAKYYKEFLRLYPDTYLTPVVKRYLKNSGG